MSIQKITPLNNNTMSDKLINSSKTNYSSKNEVLEFAPTPAIVTLEHADISMSEQNKIYIMPTYEIENLYNSLSLVNFMLNTEVPKYKDYFEYYSNLTEEQRKESSNRMQNYGVDNLYTYYKLIGDRYGDLTFQEKYRIAKQFDALDKQNNYNLAHKMPIIFTGSKRYNSLGLIIQNSKAVGVRDYTYTGNYLQFFNEYGIDVNTPIAKMKIVGENLHLSYITDDDYLRFFSAAVSSYYTEAMKKAQLYSDFYKKYTLENIDQLNLVYLDFETEDSGYLGLTGNNNINIDITNILDENNLMNYYFLPQYLDTFNHEFAHYFSLHFKVNNQSNPLSQNLNYVSYVYSKEWNTIYEQIINNEANKELLLPSCFQNSGECFAEVITELYNYDSTGEYIHNENDLKEIKINYMGYDNLFDYLCNLTKTNSENINRYTEEHAKG